MNSQPSDGAAAEWSAMQACPKLDHCSAPICPRDPQHPKRVHQPGERVCFFLCESVKLNAVSNFHDVGLSSTLGRMRDTREGIAAKHYTIRIALERASATASRLLRRIPQVQGWDERDTTGARALPGHPARSPVVRLGGTA